MKTKAISSFFVLFAIAAGVVAMTPGAFADHSEVTIVPTQGSGAPGCEEVEYGCYIPGVATVDLGGKVIFLNDDSAAHTFSAGTAADGPTGEFDTSMVMAGQSYEWTADVAGEIDYFCMVHPWMVGLLIVEEEVVEEVHEEVHEEVVEEVHEEVHEEVVEEVHEEVHEEVVEELIVLISDSAVKGGTQIDLEFSELHVNYEITATQDGEVVLQETAHAMESTASHMIDAVGSDDNPIDVDIVSLGIGAPGAEADWTGPTGSVATAKVVPEFGTIAMMILAVAIISIVAVTAKSRVIPRF